MNLFDLQNVAMYLVLLATMLFSYRPLSMKTRVQGWLALHFLLDNTTITYYKLHAMQIYIFTSSQTYSTIFKNLLISGIINVSRKNG